MTYTLYKMLQTYVHKDYAQQKAILSQEFQAHAAHLSTWPLPFRTVQVLELGCGGGNLASIFPPQSYWGLDLSAERVKAAQREYPAYRFTVCPIPSPEFETLLREFDFIFCHALLHHLDDQSCHELLTLVRSSARKPTTFVAIEPILPVLWKNPLGFLLAKLDEGKYVRTSQQYLQFFQDGCVSAIALNFFPRWPVKEEAYSFH